MSDLIRELKQRQKKVHDRFSEQFFNAVYDYIDLTVQHPVLQEILKEYQAQPNSFRSIWPDYQKIHTEVYEFIRNNPYEVVKKKYSAYYSIDDDDVDNNFGKIMLVMNPITLWALLKRLKYSFAIDRIHDGLVTSIKTRVSLSTPPTKATISAQPQTVLVQVQSLPAVQQAQAVSEPEPVYKKYPEAYRILELTDKSQWQDITIQFINAFDVKITYKGNTIKADYTALGFADNRTSQESGKRKKSWDTLMEMSVNKGVLNFGVYGEGVKDILKKQKQEICKLLQAYFGLRSDPFELDEENHTYKTKFKLLPDTGEIMVGMHRQLDEEYQDDANQNEFSP